MGRYLVVLNHAHARGRAVQSHLNDDLAPGWQEIFAVYSSSADGNIGDELGIAAGCDVVLSNCARLVGLSRVSVPLP